MTHSEKIKVVFLATPDIALKTFEFFIKSPDYELLALVTQCAKAQNRGKKVVMRNITKLAMENSIPIFEPEKISQDIETIQKLKALKPDFFVTFAFGQILSQEVINIPKFATINLHASLLPKYRGANPISQVIQDGCTKTGITTMKTALELDAGDICLQKEIDITSEMNVVELMQKISDLSPSLLDETLKGLYDGSLKIIPQDHSKATFTKKIKKEDKLIDWSMEAISLHNKIRAMYQINTNHTMFRGKIIKILKTRVLEGSAKIATIQNITKEGILVGTSKGLIELIKVKPEGKGEMNASDWARGARVKIGDCFE